MDAVTVAMATMPSRISSMVPCVYLLLRQDIQHMRIYLNNFPEDWEPPWHDSRVTCLRSEHARGDIADSGKFYWADETDGYYLTVDDDIHYPLDYIHNIIEGIESYERRAVVSMHGGITTSPISRYYRKILAKYRCTHPLENDMLVNVAGTGVMGFHTDTLRVHIDMFEKPYMADIWMGVICQQQQIPQVVLAHDKLELLEHDLENTIWHRFHLDDHEQTAAVNSIENWAIFDPMTRA